MGSNGAPSKHAGQKLAPTKPAAAARFQKKMQLWAAPSNHCKRMKAQHTQLQRCPGAEACRDSKTQFCTVSM
eukprot:4922932-Amphidinium_carterae.1